MPTRASTPPASKPRPKAKPKAAAKPPAEPRPSRTRRPAKMPVVDWQTALRRQFGREQNIRLENLGAEPVFSDYRVHNPASGDSYRAAIRGREPVALQPALAGNERMLAQVEGWILRVG